MNHRFRWTLRSSCLPHTPWLMLSTTCGGATFPMPSSFLRGWTMRSSTLLASCLPLLFKYMLNLFSFFFSWLLNVGNCNRGDLLLVSPLILHTSLGWFMLMAQMALLRSTPCPNVMGYPFPPNTWVVSSFSFCTSLSAKFLCLFQSLTLPSLNCSLLSKSMRSWYGWLGISSWRWPTTRGSYTVLEEWPHPGGGDDDDGKEEDSEVTPSYRSWKRQHHWLLAVQDTYRHTTHTQLSFFFCFYGFFFPLADIFD